VSADLPIVHGTKWAGHRFAQADPSMEAAAVVTSCEESDALDYDDDNDNDDDNDSSVEEREQDDLLVGSTNETFLDDNADDEDEAYVYKHLRGGLPENVTVRSKRQGENQQGDDNAEGSANNAANYTLKSVLMYKPRSSDAVLSCPCCFRIVCMDCQRHERYQNQYRAMFVMNIVVKWDEKLVFDEQRGKGLVPMMEDPSTISNSSHNLSPEQDFYYKVCCDYCSTHVAALDMKDEVYHFFGCMASA
jgi:E2F-associated phosphoprotein